jgi:hypothetical protein
MYHHTLVQRSSKDTHHHSSHRRHASPQKEKSGRTMNTDPLRLETFFGGLFDERRHEIRNMVAISSVLICLFYIQLSLSGQGVVCVVRLIFGIVKSVT